MSREVRRVPVDFTWPLYQRWQGYLSPDDLDEIKCYPCDGRGYSPEARKLHDLWYGYVPFDPAATGSTPFTAENPVIRARAEWNVQDAPDYYGTGEHAIVREARRLAALFNGSWSHHLAQEDVDALLAADRLWDFTRVFSREHRWQRAIGGGPVTAAAVNQWSISGMGHDSSNCHIVISARCKNAGVDDQCAHCDGFGSHEAYPGQRADAEAWQRTDPPTGDGWQLWETTSEGSPISPVFRTPEELATWMSNPDRTDRYKKDWMPYPAAMQFIGVGWAPTGISTANGWAAGAEVIGMADLATSD